MDQVNAMMNAEMARKFLSNSKLKNLGWVSGRENASLGEHKVNQMLPTVKQQILGEVKNIGVAKSGDDFTKFSTISQWFQTLIHPLIQQRQNILKESFASAAVQTDLLVGFINQVQNGVEEKSQEIRCFLKNKLSAKAVE